jgi:hypothetical protein
VNLADLFNLAALGAVVGVLAYGALVLLTHRGPHRKESGLSVSDGILGGLFLGLVIPLLLIAGVGTYILHANTGYYSRPDDFRNSAEFLQACWFVVVPVAPTLLLLGLALVAYSLFRGWRLRR